MFGYTGKIIHVNLTKDVVQEIYLNEKIFYQFIGGRGLCSKLLFEKIKPRIDPFCPDNVLIFATGPFNGLVPCKYIVAAKSPLTGILGFSLASGPFASELKLAGYDAIVIEGQTYEPKYLWVSEEEVLLKDASKVWGKTTDETEKIIKEDLGQPDAKLAVIGPAGEKMVRMACIISDGRRAAGRTGLGAIMGSKKLKAIAVKGSKKISIAREEKFRELWKNFLIDFESKPHWAKPYGTTGGIESYSNRGLLPTRNFISGTFEGAHKITGEETLASWTVRRLSCPKCPVGCWGEIEIKNGKCVGYFKGPRPEYETIAALGSCCGNEDIESIVIGNDLCNKYGIDTISVGVTIAFIMECYEKGLLTKEELGGLEPTWGDSKVILELIKKVGLKQDFGTILGNGSKKVAEYIGKKSELLAVEIKGLELPMHEPRGQKGMGLAYATSPRGACHNRGWGEARQPIPELGISNEFITQTNPYSVWGKAKIVKINQDWRAVEDSLILCYFVGLKPSLITEFLNSITGFDMSISDLLKCGERIFNQERMFNVREGITRRDDTLPQRIMEPLQGGCTNGLSISPYELNSMLDEYYTERGWDKATGIPTKEKLRELELE
ncbi:MAG: aldehyde ferredoxin oxidoreductase family protein [Nitrososphaeria archaeon]